MKIITSTAPPTAQGAILALGNFDGVHRGHQAVIKQAVTLAQQKGRPSAVMTFDPHPVQVLYPNVPFFQLTGRVQKAALIADLGVDFLWEIPFTEAFSRLSAQGFFDHMICKKAHASHIVVGHDFIFGHNREGHASHLSALATAKNIGFTQLAAHSDKNSGHVYASTAIRKALNEARLEDANAMLGRPFSLTGTVIPGAKRGKALGFPTANILLPLSTTIARGVYVTHVSINSGTTLYLGIANIGHRPTFFDTNSQNFLETHLFFPPGHSLYGALLTVHLLAYIRPEQRFPSAEALKGQILKDCQKAKDILSSPHA